ncbi:MAG: LysR substrate-binding domain-containing protein [Pseudomonadota bacterium]|nr:LysR substrate-binding domain-containing protein [Pseudomonadota bacterium]
MDWDKLRVFHAVAEAGSFTHAGEILNLSQSSVSRQVSSLEQSLNVPLFHRHARGLKLTETGETLYATAKDVFAKVAIAESLVSEARDRPQGPLRITTTVAFGSIWLTERLREFIEHYPDIQVTLIVAEDELDLSMGEADVGIRMTPPTQGDLVRRPLLTMHHRVFASPVYLKDHGTPRSVDDLDGHQIIAYDDSFHQPFTDINWLLAAGRNEDDTRDPVLRVNNIYAMFRAAASGLGIASLPDYMGQLANDLVPIMPELEGPQFDVFLVYPEELRHSQRIVAFRDFLLRSISSRRK